MSNWKRTSEKMPNPLKNVLFLTENGHIFFGWRSSKNFWYIYGVEISMPNPTVKAWCPIPEYDLEDE